MYIDIRSFVACAKDDGSIGPLSMPWHDSKTDRDVVSNGKILLMTDTHMFTGAEHAPDINALLSEPDEPIGTIDRLGDLIRWCEPPTYFCGHPLPSACPDCGDDRVTRRPGLLFGRVVDLNLIRKPLQVVWKTNCRDLPVRAGADPMSRITIQGPEWLLVIMPFLHREGQPPITAERIFGDPATVSPEQHA